MKKLGKIMKAEAKTKEQLIKELSELHKKNANLELLIDKMSENNKELEQIIYATLNYFREPLDNIKNLGKLLKEISEEITTILEKKDASDELKAKLLVILKKVTPETIKYILKDVHNLDSLLEGLFQISHFERIKLNIKKWNINELINNILKTVEFQIKCINTIINIDDKWPLCYGYEMWISQLFSNLIDNALQYIDSGQEGIITISGYNDNEHIIYCIEDNGIGIPKKHQEKIFKLFYQINPKITNKGLGLVIVNNIIRKHNGEIWVESDVGKGSKFFISLPNKSII